jgi:aspartate-semialdehyde dehydrogenase
MTRPRLAAIVGATGIAGQRFVVALQNHPWFKIARLAASARSAGKSYRDALLDPKSGARRWWCDVEPAADVLNLVVENGDDFDPKGIDLLFSATESEVAQIQEPKFAREVPVISTASAFRAEADVPLLVPNVSMHLADLLKIQRRNRGWKGFIAPNPNCTVTGLAITLKPLLDRFGIERVMVTTMQGLSGAGRSPGVPGLDILDNIVPYIAKEEEKVEKELLKIFGTLAGATVKSHSAIVSATCTRANVIEGHTEAVSVSLSKKATVDQVKAALREYPNEMAALKLPSAPKEWIHVHEDPFRPQPRLDRNRGNGMTTTVGRVREDKVLKNGIKYMLVSHNTKMGAAAGAVLVAEYLKAKGTIG